MRRPCLTCGELSEATRCPEHTTDHRTVIERDRVRLSPRERGYDTAWSKLSKRARSIQTYCSDCGTTDDLTCDHSPEAWAARARGERITLAMVDVVCADCNSRRGTSRPGSERAHASR